jgi:hypothetical protein
MSFLSGILDIGKSVVGFLGGNSVWSSLAKTALMGFALNRLNSNTNKGSDAGKEINIDKGVRLNYSQPKTEHYIPVLYGSAFFGGFMFDIAMSADRKTMYYATALCEKTSTNLAGAAPTYTFKDVYWENQRVQFKSDGVTVDFTRDNNGTIDRSLSGLVKIYHYAGGRTAGQVPTGYSGTVPNAETIFPNWTSATHALDGLVFAIIVVSYNREKNVTGIAQDMRWEVASNNFLPGDVLYDYLTSTRYGAGIPAADIDTTSLSALNTYAAQPVTFTLNKTDGTTLSGQVLADRYQINGIIDTKDKVYSNIEKICNAAASWLTYDNYEGKWGVIINKSGSSVASFNDNNILGSISVSSTGLRDLYNSVKVEFANRELNDSGDFVSISLLPADLNDNEIPNPLPLGYDIINDGVQAKLLGFIELKQSRVDKIIQFQTDFSYINLKPGDIVSITNSRLTFSSKLFRIITISEQQEEGALMLDITALEYDTSVYDESILDKYEVETEDGIITLGDIGTPGTPQVDTSTYSFDSRPRVVIDSDSPYGIVEGMEFWLTYDVTVPDDAARTYSLITTVRPTSGTTFSSGETVSFEYSSIGNTNFIVKTRGVNNFTAGPFSTPSGSIYFEPVQTTDAITPNTEMYSTSGLLTGLTLVSLANKLLDLFGSGNDSKSIFERIFDVFRDETGVDLVGDAAGGDLVVASQIGIASNGTNLTSTVASIDFASGLAAEASGSAVTAKIRDGVKPNDILVWDGGEWVVGEGCCPFTPQIVEQPTPVDPEQCFIDINGTLPASNSTLAIDSCSTVIPLIPNQGSYFLRFSSTFPFYGPVEKGLGNIEMYQTDGVLHESLPVASTIIHRNTVELPFTKARQLGTDYYIIMPRGAFTYCGCPSKEILPPNGGPTTWDFTVAPYKVSNYDAGRLNQSGSQEYSAVRPTGDYTAVAASSVINDAYNNEDGSDKVFIEKEKTPYSSATDTEGVCVEKYLKDFGEDMEVYINWNEEVVKLSGTIDIIDAETGNTVITKSVASMSLDNEPIKDAIVTAKLGNDKNYLSDGTLNTKTSTTDKVVLVQVKQGGGGYKSDTVSVTFSSPSSGQKALGTANVNGNGVITGITITDPGWGYTSPPTVTIKGERDYSLMPADYQGKKPNKTEAFYPNRRLTIGKVKDLGLTRGKRYVVRVPQGVVMTKRVACPSDAAIEVVNRQTNWSFLIAPALTLIKYELCSTPNVNDTTFQKVNIRSNIWLYFNKKFKIKETAPANVVIYESGLFGDSVHQTIDLRKTFTDDRVGALTNYWLEEQTAGNEDLDPDDETILKINPTKPFKPNTTYYIQVASGTLIGAFCEDPWVGATDDETITWKTDGIENVPPEPLGAGTPFNREITFEYGAPVIPSGGMLSIKDGSGNVVTQIPSNHPAITYST